MVTTVDIPDDLLEEARKLTGLPTKKAVVNLAISELVQGYRQRRALGQLAELDHNPFLTDDELSAEAND